MNTNQNIYQILKKYWGYDSYRSMQEEIINEVLKKNDTLALLPTGGGKSICFQVPALAMEGTCLVISPLIALIQDQVSMLKKRGIKALAVVSGMGKREVDITLDNVVYGDYKFLYVSPERLETEIFQERLKKMNISMVAVDEAHCISQWGYDFRPSYLKIGKLRETLIEVPFLALTATATVEVIADIQTKLGFKKENLFKKSFERKNLAYVVLNDENPYDRAIKIARGVEGSGIVYVGTRKKAKEVSGYLTKKGFSADYYHAGLPFEDRKEKLNSWLTNKVQIIVATNAFGMGIDKPNVRFVIHIDLPQSIESYFQEAGRAGRDERKAYAVAITTTSNLLKLKESVHQNFPPIKVIKKTYQALGNHLQIALGHGEGEQHNLDIQEFSRKYKLTTLEVAKSIDFLAKEGLLEITEGYSRGSRVFIKQNKETLYQVQLKNRNYDRILKTLLRMYGGVFDGFVFINEKEMARNIKLPHHQVIKELERLSKLELIEYERQSELPKVSFLKGRVEQKALRISSENYANRKQAFLKKVEATLNYFVETKTCRSVLLLRYFAEQTEPCGICDWCIDQKKNKSTKGEGLKFRQDLMTSIELQKKTTQEILAMFPSYKSTNVLKELSLLIDNNKIETDGVRFWAKKSANDPNID